MNLRPQKRYEPKDPKLLWTRETKTYESKGTRCFSANRESRSMFCECIWGRGAAPSPPTPLQLFSLNPHLERLHLLIETIEKYNSQNKQ